MTVCNFTSPAVFVCLSGHQKTARTLDMSIYVYFLISISLHLLFLCLKLFVCLSGFCPSKYLLGCHIIAVCFNRPFTIFHDSLSCLSISPLPYHPPPFHKELGLTIAVSSRKENHPPSLLAFFFTSVSKRIFHLLLYMISDT